MEKRVKVALIDLSGTLQIEDSAIAGAQDALKKLKENNVKVKIVTNTTKEPLRVLHNKSCENGFDIEKEDFFTSLTAARALVTRRELRPLLMLEQSAKEDFEGVFVENPNAVVVGLAPSCFGYESMNEAFRLVLTGAPLIAINKGRYFKRKDGLKLGPDCYLLGRHSLLLIKVDIAGEMMD